EPAGEMRFRFLRVAGCSPGLGAGRDGGSIRRSRRVADPPPGGASKPSDWRPCPSDGRACPPGRAHGGRPWVLEPPALRGSPNLEGDGSSRYCSSISSRKRLGSLLVRLPHL